MFSSINSTLTYSAEIKTNIFALQPFGGKDDNGKLIGIIPEILQALKIESKLDINVDITPYKRMFQALETGTIDFAIFFLTDKSIDVALPVVKVYTLKNIVVGKENLNLSNYNDLLNHNIAVPNGVFFKNTFDSDPKLNKMLVPGFENAVKLLLRGRVELVAGPEISITHHLRNLDTTGQRLGKPYVIGRRSAWLQVSERSKNLSPELLEKLADSINELRNNGTIKSILAKYRQNKAGT